MIKITLEEFREYCIRNDYNILYEWDFKRFGVICEHCKSSNIQIGHKTKQLAEGSTQTGIWTREEEGLLIKCLNCGLAMTIIKLG